MEHKEGVEHMERERRWILTVCDPRVNDGARIRAIMEEPLDGAYMLGQLLFHRVGGLACEKLERLSLLEGMNREFRNTLLTVYRDGGSKTTDFLQLLEMLAGILKEADFPYALLKGAFLAGIYPHGCRTSNDIDLLLRAEDLDRLTALLTARGFAQGWVRSGRIQPATRGEVVAARMNRGETIPFLRETGLRAIPILELDVNFSLDCAPGNGCGAVPRMLEEARPRIETSAGALRTLSEEDFLIHLCCHLYKEAAAYPWVRFGRDQGLYKYCDIALCLLRYGSRALEERLAARIRALGLEKECYFALYHTNALFPLANTELLRRLTPADDSFLREVTDPGTGKRYRHELPTADWVFCGRRKEMLHEITDAETTA